MRAALAPHRLVVVATGTQDVEILHSAENQGAIVITSDVWFLKELFRLPATDRKCFTRAGVVQVPGEWEKVQGRLTEYLPLIEAVYRITRGRSGNQRIGINLAKTEIRIMDPRV